MSDDDQHVTQKRAADDDECQGADRCCGKGLPIGRKQVAAGEGQDAERGEGEHPFHDGRERVTGDEILVQHEVECVTQLREQDQQVARDGVPSGTVRISAAEDQQQGSRGSGGDAECTSMRGDS